MHIELLHFLAWLQAPGTAPSSAPVGSGPAAGGLGMGWELQVGLLAIVLLVFYFLMIRPEEKRHQEHKNFLKSLRPGQKVRTRGGILGEIISIDEQETILAIGQKEKVRINVLLSHIAGPAEPPKTAGEKKSDEKKDEKKKDERKPEDKPSGES